MKKLKIEIADTPNKRELGLMGRKNLDSDRGMLFKFPESQHLGFWMKNTYIPLDIAFLNEKGIVTQIEKMAPLSTRSIRSILPCKYALEVNKGWFDDNNIGIGDSIFGDGITHKHKREIVAQGKGFLNTIKDLITRPFKKKKEEPKKEDKDEPKIPSTILEEKKEEPVEPTNIKEEPLTPPEQKPEGAEYPQSAYVEQYQNADEPQINWLRDLRGRIRFANEFGLKMDVIYWTLNGHVLPPRRIMALPGEGYVVKNGPHGEYLVAFDMSPNISGGDGWTIKGNQPKSFLLDNIVNLSVLDMNNIEIKPEALEEMKRKNREDIEAVM